MARAGLTHERIVDAALALADEQGTQALTMRGLARRLGVDPMAVYRHVANKAELLGAMCDMTVAQLTPLDPGGPWEPQLRAMAGELRAALLARPSLAPVLLTAPATPAATAATRAAIALLVAAGLDERRAAGAFAAIFTYAVGATAMEVAGPPPVPAADLRSDTLALLEGDAAHLDAAIELMQAPAYSDDGLELMLLGIRALLEA